jgi:hypothetical protein
MDARESTTKGMAEAEEQASVRSDDKVPIEEEDEAPIAEPARGLIEGVLNDGLSPIHYAKPSFGPAPFSDIHSGTCQDSVNDVASDGAVASVGEVEMIPPHEILLLPTRASLKDDAEGSEQGEALEALPPVEESPADPRRRMYPYPPSHVISRDDVDAHNDIFDRMDTSYYHVKLYTPREWWDYYKDQVEDDLRLTKRQLPALPAGSDEALVQLRKELQLVRDQLERLYTSLLGTYFDRTNCQRERAPNNLNHYSLMHPPLSPRSKQVDSLESSVAYLRQEVQDLKAQLHSKPRKRPRLETPPGMPDGVPGFLANAADADDSSGS